MNAPARISAVQPCALSWWQSDKARDLLGQLDAAERYSDHFSGMPGWYSIADECANRAKDIEGELDNLRTECIRDFADAAGERHSDEFLDAWEIGDSEALTVEAACQQARRLGWGASVLKGEME